jgi:hypothetical protein
MKTLHFPVTVVDDFFNYPYEVRKFALQQEYFSDTENRWPGKRTKPLHELNLTLYNTIIGKVVSLFYDLKKLEAQLYVDARFQLTDKEYEEGWIHTDTGCLATGIIYLSDQICNSGTTIYRPVDSINTLIKHNDKKKKSYSDTTLISESKDFRLENNKQFRPTVTVENEYNRLVLFDSHLYHSANNFYGDGAESNRLTLVFFVHKINFNTAENVDLPIHRSRTFIL